MSEQKLFCVHFPPFFPLTENILSVFGFKTELTIASDWDFEFCYIAYFNRIKLNFFLLELFWRIVEKETRHTKAFIIP